VSLMGRRVLVVEDEALIAMLIEDYLLDLGCTVAATAARLDDGLEKATGAAIDLAVLDINLAGALSYPIAEALRARGIPFIFATGYGAAGLPDGLQGTPVLAKPFDETQLAEALERALRGAASQAG
jgi:CheY-like chemotaxis protein